MNHGFEELSKQVIGAAIKVHKTLGPGFKENIYEQALILELEKLNLKLDRQKVIKVKYNGASLGNQRIDLMVESQIIVETKVAININKVFISQIISYLKTTGLRIGLILNFGKDKLEIKRVVV